MLNVTGAKRSLCDTTSANSTGATSSFYGPSALRVLLLRIIPADWLFRVESWSMAMAVLGPHSCEQLNEFWLLESMESAASSGRALFRLGRTAVLASVGEIGNVSLCTPISDRWAGAASVVSISVAPDMSPSRRAEVSTDSVPSGSFPAASSASFPSSLRWLLSETAATGHWRSVAPFDESPFCGSFSWSWVCGDTPKHLRPHLHICYSRCDCCLAHCIEDSKRCPNRTRISQEKVSGAALGKTASM